MAGGFYEQLGANIRKRRERLGLTQEFIAKDVGLSRISVVNIEAGRQRVAVHQLLDFATALEISPAALLRDLQ